MSAVFKYMIMRQNDNNRKSIFKLKNPFGLQTQYIRICAHSTVLQPKSNHENFLCFTLRGEEFPSVILANGMLRRREIKKVFL